MGIYNRPIAAWPGDVELLPHLLGVLKEGALDVEVAFGTSIAVATTTNRKQLSATTENEIRDMLQEMLHGRGTLK
jgi:1-acyl-sn-glycerol-3-phosphate acyltransferase